LSCRTNPLIGSKAEAIKHATEESHYFYYDLDQSESICLYCETIEELKDYTEYFKKKVEEEKIVALLSGMSLAEKKLSYESLVQRIKEGKYRKIVVLTGAGISVSAGIPDFRSPGSGIYANL
jgi:superfamily I DNA/RNA helicase